MKSLQGLHGQMFFNFVIVYFLSLNAFQLIMFVPEDLLLFQAQLVFIIIIIVLENLYQVL